MENTTILFGCHPPCGGMEEGTREELVEYLGEPSEDFPNLKAEALVCAAETAWPALRDAGCANMTIWLSPPDDDLIAGFVFEVKGVTE